MAWRPNRPKNRNQADARPGPAPPAQGPELVLLEITGIDSGGDAIARPVIPPGGKRPEGRPPLITMAPEKRGQPALAPGAKVMARLRPLGRNKFEGRTVSLIGESPGRIIGVFHPAKPHPGSLRHLPPQAGRIVPADRRSKAEWLVPPGEENGAVEGEIVVGIPLPHHGAGLKPARVAERLGAMGDARSVSLICIASLGIPHVFPAEAIAQAKRARAAPLGKRADLRAVPLITIDGEDARDFDDAVYAAPDGGGFRLIVAIADVAHYVRPGSALDIAAKERGNSVYFPDRVVPMLPEALSNGWCSLRPDEDRGCLYVEIAIGKDGNKTSHRFGRGLMRSAARLTYEQIEAARASGDSLGLPEGLIACLYAAFDALLAARIARGTLDLDLPERKVTLDSNGSVTAIAPRPRLNSHRLIEEFMVLANVCAAEELERLHSPCVYRIHAPPGEEKLDNLRDFLASLAIKLPPGNQLHPRDLDRVLQKVAGTPQAPLVNDVMLRAQSQAAYSPDNIGHFGLALARYAHFTSPIRRYADLLVHRSLIKGLKLGADGLTDTEAAALPDIADQITGTERRAALAERDAIDRYLAAYMADKIGSDFAARISGVTRSALFVTLTETGASGIVPFSGLPDDFWIHDERTQTLSGRRTRIEYRLAQNVTVTLAETSPLTGGMAFKMALENQAGRPRQGSSRKWKKR
jgi:ribonuclease R